MPDLANIAVSQIYTIPVDDWTAINKRVGVVLLEQQIQQIVAASLPGYPALLASCQTWTQATFHGLITESKALAAYAANAIANFSDLNETISKITGNTVPADVQQQTSASLKKLSDDTLPLAAASKQLADQIMTFLDDNVVVDGQLAAHEGQIGSFWAPVGARIKSLEQANSLVRGEWGAIVDDLANASAPQVSVTMPFLAALNLDAAVVSWRTVQSEAGQFANLVAGQDQYWTNPF